jgi:hypothetical protein
VNTTGEWLHQAAEPWIKALRQPVKNRGRRDHGFGETAVQVNTISAQAWAEVLTARSAVAAMTTVCIWLNRDHVAFCQTTYAGTYRIDDARDFMSQNNRTRGRKFSMQDMRVRSTNACCQGAKADLSTLRHGHR